MIRHIITLIVFLFLSFIKTANAEELTRDVWEVYEKGTVYLIALHKQSNELVRITFEFNYESEDGLTYIATIRGHSVGKLIPLPVDDECFYVKLYEKFELTKNSYIVCETEGKVLLSNIDVNTPPAMPMHLIFSKTEHSNQ